MSMHDCIQAIIFDLDNTLIDRDEALRQYLINTWSPSTTELSNWLTLDDHGYADRDFICASIAQARRCNPEDVWQDMRANISLFVQHSSSLQNALKSLLQRRPCGLLSNGSGFNQRLKLKHAGLEYVFEEHVTWISGELGVSKPDLDAFTPALDYFARLHIKPHQIIMIGDDAHRDIMPAKTLGMMTGWVQHHNKWPTLDRPDMVLSDVKAVETWIETWTH